MDEALLMGYLEHARACGEKPATLERRQFWVQLFCAHFRERGWSLEELSRERLEECTQWLLWTPRAGGKLRSPNTVYQGMAMLRQFLRWAAAQGVLEENPTSGWLLSRPTARERVLLTRAQVDAILNSPPRTPLGLQDRAILHTMAELGLYGKPCAELDLADLDLASYQLRRMRLSAHLAEHLHNYLQHGRPALLSNPDEPALFLGKAGLRLGGPGAETALHRYSAGLRISPRTLRRSWMAHRDAIFHRRLPEG